MFQVKVFQRSRTQLRNFGIISYSGGDILDATQVLLTGEYKLFDRNYLQNGRMNRFDIKERCAQCSHHCMHNFDGSITLAFGLNNSLKAGQQSFLYQDPRELVINFKELVQKIFLK